MVETDCEHFNICGGCKYRDIPYEEQLKMKEETVRDLIKDYIDDDCVWEGVVNSPEIYGYRNKMEFSFGDACKDGELELGMHKRGSFHDIVTVSDCKIIDDDYRKILIFTRDYFRENKVKYYHRKSHEGYLRHLIVRKGRNTKEILIDLVTSTQYPENVGDLIDGYKERLLKLSLDGEIKSILNTLNDSLSDAIKNEKTDILYGMDYFYEELLGLKFKISPFSFFQTNSASAEVIYTKAREFIKNNSVINNSVIYDLYSGTGTITQLMAPACKKIIGVEIVEEAVEAAKENAKLNGIDNCDFIAGDVLKVLDSIEEKPDYIIVDPPRDGVNPKALRKIMDYSVDNILYISCNPKSLARDLQMLAWYYKPKRVCVVDQFPFTANIETVVLLNNKNSKPKSYVEIGVDADDYYRIKEGKN